MSTTVKSVFFIWHVIRLRCSVILSSVVVFPLPVLINKATNSVVFDPDDSGKFRTWTFLVPWFIVGILLSLVAAPALAETYAAVPTVCTVYSGGIPYNAANCQAAAALTDSFGATSSVTMCPSTPDPWGGANWMASSCISTITNCYYDGSCLSWQASVLMSGGTCPGGGTLINNGYQCMGPPCPPGQSRNQTIGKTQGQCVGIPSPANNGDSCPKIANPINPAVGNKFQIEIDSAEVGEFPLLFTRTYNSITSATTTLGVGWQHSYERYISVLSSGAVEAMRPDGKAYTFSATNGVYSTPETNDTLQALTVGPIISGWKYVMTSGESETYNVIGQLLFLTDRTGRSQTLTYDANAHLIRVTDNFGRQLNFTYDTNSRISTLTDPAGGLYHYAYDANNNLASVTYPDGKSKIYHYENTSFPHALTGITDENGNRYATYTYDAQGRATSSEHAGGAERVSLVYNANGSTTVTDALNTARTYNFQTLFGVVKSTGQSQPGGSGCGASASALTYDANGNTTSRTDFNGNVSCYAYDLSRNLETARLEGMAPGSSCPANLAAYTPATGSNVRKISTQWHASYRLPVQIDQVGQRLNFSYDASGNLLQKTVTDTATQQIRTWTHSYNGIGQILTEDGPRTDASDITTYSYYSDSTSTHKPGDLWKVINALGHVTTYITYDANGRLLSLTDPNGLVISLAYDSRGRLTQKTVGGNTTTYSYDAAGNLLKVTQPTGVAISYTYDAAHRLTDITDGLGGKIHYTLDAMDNRIKEDILNANGIVVKTQSRVYDALARLQKDIGAYNQTANYQYDANGNLIKITDANGNATQRVYDTLNRLTRSTDALAGQTNYQYDVLDRLTQVTDANNHSTSYSYNGLSDLLQLNSPNTGVSQYAYDSAGNLLQKTDAANTVAHYRYDSLNRLTGVDYPGTDADVVNTYDGNPNQKGRLTSAQRGDGATSYTYDLLGNVTSTTALALPHPGYGNTINYSYNADSRISDIAFSTYRDVQYQYDLAGRISQISVHDVDGGAFSSNGYNLIRSLATNITHLPFGPVNGLTYGNGLAMSRSYDLDYHLAGQSVGNVQNLAYSYDHNGNLQTANDLLMAVNSQSLSYDAVNRLRLVNGAKNFMYGYDAVGNRMSDYQNNAGTQYYYDLSSQKLLSQTGARPDTILTDATGNITQSGGKSYTYAPDQRLASVQQNGNTIATYNYDSQGQRIVKTTSTGTTNFDYDLQGRLLEENDIPGNYVYLDGEPLARVDYNLSDTTGNVASWNIVYYHNNPIGTPIKTTDPLGNVSWTGQLDSFGKVLPVNPAITQNLRFPGQYYDQETGLHYNMQRYYDELSGRYLQSDPIGLAGGINTYTYVHNNPLRWTDPFGLYDLSFSAGFHLPVSPGVAVGEVFSSSIPDYSNNPGNSLVSNPPTTDIEVGAIADIGVSVGVSDISGTGGKCAGNTINLGAGRYAGAQITLRQSQDQTKSIFDPARYIDGASFGLGLGIASPATVSRGGN